MQLCDLGHMGAADSTTSLLLRAHEPLSWKINGTLCCMINVLACDAETSVSTFRLCCDALLGERKRQ